MIYTTNKPIQKELEEYALCKLCEEVEADVDNIVQKYIEDNCIDNQEVRLMMYDLSSECTYKALQQAFKILREEYSEEVYKNGN